MGITDAAAGDGRALVRELARASGTRLRHDNTEVPVDGGPFDRQTRVLRGGTAVRVRSNGRWMRVEVDRDGPFVVAIGRKDRIFPADLPAGAVDGLPLYVTARADDAERGAAVEWLKLQSDVLGRVKLESGEGILIAQNKVSALLRPTPLEAFMHRLDAVHDLAEALPSAPEADEGDTEVRMPAGLEALDDLAAVWAIDDDEDREELMDDASDAALEELYARVEPISPRSTRCSTRRTSRRRPDSKPQVASPKRRWKRVSS